MTETALEAGSLPDTEQPTETPETAAPDPSEKPDPNVTANGEKLDRQTRNWRALERDRDHWREMAMLHAKPSREAPPADDPEPADTVKTLADFEYDEAKFQKHIFEQAEKRSVAVARRELEQAREQEAAQRRVQSFKAREAEFAKTVEDYEEVAHYRANINAAMADVIRESDDGPALAYHLGKNPEIAEKIAQLPPIAAARELGMIEARLAFEREQAKAAKVSKAPPPPPKVDGVEAPTSVRVDTPEGDSLSDEEWVRRRNKQIERRRST